MRASFDFIRTHLWAHIETSLTSKKWGGRRKKNNQIKVGHFATKKDEEYMLEKGKFNSSPVAICNWKLNTTFKF